MARRFALLSALLLAMVLPLVAQSPDSKSGSWTGVITDNICGAKNAGEAGATCTKQCVSQKGAKLALYVPSTKKLYVLEPQDKAAGHEGHNVIVQGTLAGDSKAIHVTSLAMNKKESSM